MVGGMRALNANVGRSAHGMLTDRPETLRNLCGDRQLGPGWARRLMHPPAGPLQHVHPAAGARVHHCRLQRRDRAATRTAAGPCGLAEGPDQRQVAPAVRTLIGGIGARDAAIGTAMVVAPRGPALRLAILAPVASFGSRLPDPSRGARIAGFAAVWAGLCALSARWAG
jgi:hypothetical protein